MDSYNGVLEFTFYGRTIRIPYSMNNLGGSPHIYFADKYGGHHGFFRRPSTGEWIYYLTVAPKWRPDFMEVLFQMFDQARVRHGLK